MEGKVGAQWENFIEAGASDNKPRALLRESNGTSFDGDAELDGKALRKR